MNNVVLDYSTKKEAMAKMNGLVPGEPEMTDFESAFLCGLLNEKKPHKLVEIGVAAGGTTAIILTNIIKQDIGEFEMHSCDYSQDYYKHIKINGEYKRTGFLADNIIANSNINHEFHLGGVLPDFIETIGSGIDFVVIDTVHSLPGEVLDFLCVLPFLSKNATVVLHDISYNLFRKYTVDEMATNVLYQNVCAEKRLNKLNEGYPNIGAFSINDDTIKYIENIFGILMLKWTYCPHNVEMTKYRKIYSKFYDDNCLWIFDEAIKKHEDLSRDKLSILRRIKKSIKILIRG